MNDMTARTVPPGREEDASLRPVPWRGMAWVTWRQHRIALAGAAVFLCALAACLWRIGLGLHQVYSAAAGCHPATSPICDQLQTNLAGMDAILANGYVLQAVPAVIGAFVGAPVLARELETGTFRYAWTQGFSRWRWTLAKLVPLAAAATAGAGAFSFVVSWYYRPYLTNGNLFLPETSPLAGLFALRGVAFAAWTLAAFAIGALAGLLIRRVVPAIAATLAAYTGLALAAGLYLRQHYAAPLLTSKPNVPGSAWIMSQWWTKGGKFAFAGRPPEGLLEQLCPNPPLGPGGKPSHVTLAHCLAQHGYAQWTSYQPVSRFWPFQWIEGGWLLALSVLLIAATIWLVRRRAA